MPRVRRDDKLLAPPVAPLVGADRAEQRMIALTMAETERRLMDHSASDSVLIHFLKLGTVRAELEIARIKNETILLDARAVAIKQQSNSGDGYQAVIDAILGYRGNVFDEDLS